MKEWSPGEDAVSAKGVCGFQMLGLKSLVTTRSCMCLLLQIHLRMNSIKGQFRKFLWFQICLFPGNLESEHCVICEIAGFCII